MLNLASTYLYLLLWKRSVGPAAGTGGAGVALGRGEGTPHSSSDAKPSGIPWHPLATWSSCCGVWTPFTWHMRIATQSGSKRNFRPAGGELELAGNIPLRNDGNFVMAPTSSKQFLWCCWPCHSANHVRRRAACILPEKYKPGAVTSGRIRGLTRRSGSEPI